MQQRSLRYAGTSIVFYDRQGHYDLLGVVRTFLRGIVGADVYITSGGPSGGTFRLNPD